MLPRFLAPSDAVPPTPNANDICGRCERVDCGRSGDLLRQYNHQMARAVVDLRDRAVARGTEPPPNEAPLEIPRNVSHLEIYMPLGSSDGPYDVRVSSVRNEELSHGHGDAELSKGQTVLRVDLEPPLSSPGSFLLRFRRPNADWISFPVHIR